MSLLPQYCSFYMASSCQLFWENGYFQADGRSCRKLWSRLMCEPLDLTDTRHLWSCLGDRVLVTLWQVMYQLTVTGDVPSPPELKTIPLHFLLSFFSTFCCTFWGKSILMSIWECSAAWGRHGAGVTVSWSLLWAAHCNSMLKFKDRGLSPITADSNRSFSQTSLVVNLASRVMAEVSCHHCLEAMTLLQMLLKEMRVLHWLNRVCLTAVLTGVQISVLPDE